MNELRKEGDRSLSLPFFKKMLNPILKEYSHMTTICLKEKSWFHVIEWVHVCGSVLNTEPIRSVVNTSNELRPDQRNYALDPIEKYNSVLRSIA